MNANDVARTILWHRGDLSWKLHAAQRVLEKTFKQARGQLFVGNCSRQWGKSFWAVKLAVETAIKLPKAQIRYGAAFQSDLVDFIIPAFEKILDDAPKSVRGRKVGNYYVFPNGSRIKLIGLDKNPNGLRGNTLDLIIIDECGFVSNLEYIYKSVIVPSTLHRPNCRIVMISTPPSTPAHAFVDIFVAKARTEGSYVKLDIHTNPLITEADIERMARESGGRDTTTFRREYLCEFVTDSNLQIIPEWNESFVQAIARDEFYGYYQKYVGMDLGIKHDLTAILYSYYDFKRAQLIIEDEGQMSGPDMNTEVLVASIKAKENMLWGNRDNPRDLNNRSVPYRRVSDNNWPLLVADLSSLHNLTFIETNKDLLEAMINEVRLWVQDGHLIVHPRCKMLIGALSHGVWDDKRKQFSRSPVYGHYDHLAALVYLIRNVTRGTNPIPRGHGFENHTAWLGNIKNEEQSHNAREIGKALKPKAQFIATSSRKRGWSGR